MDALTAFHFLRPWWLLAIPLWVWLSLYTWRKAQSGGGWAAVCDPALLGYLVGANEKRQRSKAALSALMLAGCAALIALAGPVWKQLPQPVYQAQSALVIGLDLSRSMLAEDLKPDRLERAKQKLQDVLSSRKEGQTALVVFAGDAFDVIPLTSDNRAILAMLDALEPSMMPVQGSLASTALKHAQAIFKRGAIVHGTVLLLTDGVDAAAAGVAAKLAEAGHSVSIIGVGTEVGAPIPDSGEQGGFVKDSSGHIVIPRLQTDVLRRLAEAGHGVYQPIRFDDTDINRIPGLQPSATAAMSKQQKLQTDLWREEGPWLLLLVLPLFSLVFRRGVLLSLLLLPLFVQPGAAQAMDWKNLWQTPDQQGQQLMQQGKAEAAAKLFHNPDWKGVSLYRAKKYKQAAEALGGADSVDSVDTIDNIDNIDRWYNRGNALAKSGDLKGAIDAYDHALKLDKINKDAQFNRDLVKKAMQKQSRKKKSNKFKNSKPKSSKSKENKSGQKKSDQKKPGQQGKNGQKKNDQAKNKQDRNGGQGKQDKRQNQKQGKSKQPGQQDSEQPPRDSRPNQSKKNQQKGADKRDKQRAAQSSPKASDQKDKEAAAALQQWLRRIPDDPGGLLRRKFRYQYQQRGKSKRTETKAW